MNDNKTFGKVLRICEKFNCLIAYHTCTNLRKTVLKTIGHLFTDLMKGMMDNHLQPLGIDDFQLTIQFEPRKRS